MAKGHENLKPLTQRTKEEQREICSKGGRASVAARRRKKKASGIKEDDATYSAAMAFSAMYHAMKGNSQMMRLVFEMMGESPDIRIREKEAKLKEETFKEKMASMGQNSEMDDVQILLPERVRDV